VCADPEYDRAPKGCAGPSGSLRRAAFYDLQKEAGGGTVKRAHAELAGNEEALKRTLEELRAANQELKETQLQLIQAARLESVGALAAGVAHEVKNPLQTILMGLDYLVPNCPAGNETWRWS